MREVSRVVGYNLAAFSKNPDYLSDPALLSHTHTLPQRRGDFGPSQDCVTEEVENFQQPTIVIGVFDELCVDSRRTKFFQCTHNLALIS